MNNIGIGTQILLWLIVLHLVVGFGFVIYKLSPRKGDKKNEDSSDEEK